MNQLKKHIFFVIGTGTLILYSMSALGSSWRTKPFDQIKTDTVFTKLFQNESDFDFHIAEELQLFNSYENLDQIEEWERDSLYQLLNERKQISIDKKDLWKFLGFVVDTPDIKQIISQTVDILPKEKIRKIEFDIKEGDYVFFNYSAVVSRGSAVQIEVLLNNVEIDQSLSLNRKKKIEFDFIAQQGGKVEIVFKNFSVFRHEGYLDVSIRAKKEGILLQEIHQPITQMELTNTVVLDTLFEDIFDKEINLSHRLNIVKNALFEESIEFNKNKELIGFSVFFFPSEQKDNLQYERKETWREDPLQDFSIKELTGRSFTYLPEFTFSELDFLILNKDKRKIWQNGQTFNNDQGWAQSPNSKSNYAMFRATMEWDKTMIYLRISNNSTLYDFNLGIRVVALFKQSFSVKKEVEVKTSLEKILLSLV